MGFFSWKCAKSGMSVANVASGLPAKYSDCYLITPSETIHEPAYEGYGVFGGNDVYALLGDGDRILGIERHFSKPKTAPFNIKIVLAEHYNGETYEELPESKNCPYQGYFFDENYFRKLGSG